MPLFQNRDYRIGNNARWPGNAKIVLHLPIMFSEHVCSRFSRYLKAAPCDFRPIQRHQNSVTKKRDTAQEPRRGKKSKERNLLGRSLGELDIPYQPDKSLDAAAVPKSVHTGP